VPAAQQAGVVLQLCDGATNTEVKGLRPGEAMSHEQAVAVTGKLMAEWQRKHPGQHWEMAQAIPARPRPPHQQRPLRTLRRHRWRVRKPPVK